MQSSSNGPSASSPPSPPSSRRGRGWLLAGLMALAAGGAAAQPVAVGPIRFDEPEFPDAFDDFTISTLDGAPIPRITFRHGAEMGVVDGLDQFFGEENISSPLQDPVLVAPELDALRLELGGDASALSFHFGVIALPIDILQGSHGVEVRLLGAGGVQVGHALGSLPPFSGTEFGGFFQINSGVPFRAVEISGFFSVPAQIATLYLDNLAVTLVPDEAPPVVLGPEETISDAGALPAVATDPAGLRAVAWEETAGGSREVFAQLFDADGRALGNAFRVNERSSADDLAPSIAFDADGQVVVSWLRGTLGAASAGAAGSILARRFDPKNGVPQGSEIVVAQGAAVPPSVDASAGGAAVVTWGTGAGVLGRRVDRNGAPQGGAFDVASRVGAAGARVATSAAGDFFVVWSEPDGAGAGEPAEGAAATAAAGTILGRFFDVNGVPKDNAFPISSPGAGAAAPAVAADAAGNVVVVWQQAGAGGNDVLGRRFGRGGATAGPSFGLSANAAGDQTAPSVAVNAAGDIVVAWESTLPAGSGGSASADGTSILGRVFDGSSLAASDEIEVATVDGGATPGSPQVAIDDGDDATVVYQRRTAGGSEAGLFSRKLDAALAPVPCAENQETLCLAGGRFEVRVTWRDFSGNTGVANAEPLTADTGYFWFFDPANVEIVLKVLDARSINDFFWVFYGALSNVEYTISVHDTETGQGKTYFNPAERFASAGDTGAIPGAIVLPWGERAFRAVEGGEPFVAEQASAACSTGPTTLCLQQSRFAITITWRDFGGQSGVGQAVPLSSDTGYFWFFDPANVEVVIKVLDGRVFNGQFWVFYGALTNVEFTLTVTDTVTGASRQYVNPPGVFASVGDTAALPGG